MTAASLAHIPPGRYMVPVVDRLNAYWAQLTPANPRVIVNINGAWQSANQTATELAAGRIIDTPTTARLTYGRITGRCPACDRPTSTEDDRRIGAHRECVADRKTFEATTANVRQATRARAVADLLDAWRDAPHDRRIRTLVNAGPITLEKLDATAARVRESLPVVGMPMPAHVIRDRHDPRIPEWAAGVADRVAALAGEALGEVWHWVAVEEMRHQVADLTEPGPAERMVEKLDRLEHARALLAVSVMMGRMLYAHVACAPGLVLMVTHVPDASNGGTQ